MEEQGTVSCGKWIKRPENVNLVVLGKSLNSSKSALEVFSFDPISTSLSSCPLAAHDVEDGQVISIAVHPSGDEIVCATSSGDCKVFELHVEEGTTKLLAKEAVPLQGVGQQQHFAFSVDGSKLAMGGEDGHLRIFEWPSMRVILHEPKAHKSFRDMDFSLDSEFLASTSTDGSARVWNANEGVPITTLMRNGEEKIELCCFSKDGTKPFLFCTVRKGDKMVTAVWDMGSWNRIGHKTLLKKPASVMSSSIDGKYLALGSQDGDFCVVEVKKMQISHWSRQLHPGTSIMSLEFCPTERVVLTVTKEWGVKVTKLTVPADWKEWQIYLVLLGLFLASAVIFYIFYLMSDSFWNVPTGDETTRETFNTILDNTHPPFDDDPLGQLDL